MSRPALLARGRLLCASIGAMALAMLISSPWQTVLASDSSPENGKGGDQPATMSVDSESVTTLQVRPNVYMLTVAGRNVAVQVGADGVILVNPGRAGAADKILQAIKRVTDKRIRFVIDTSADADIVGNNAAIAKAGLTITGGGADLSTPSHPDAPIIAQENVVTRMLSAPPGGVADPGAALPSQVYGGRERAIYLNEEPIDIRAQPAAHSDGDSIVFFRRSDVVVTGDIFDWTRFPVIDVQNGGSIQGEIDALNQLLDLVVPVVPLAWREGEVYGTLVIPARGRLCDQAEIVQYRDMVTIIRDNIRDLIKQGKTLEQVKAANPAAAYTPRFGSTTGDWTTNMFVEAVYKSLKAAKK